MPKTGRDEIIRWNDHAEVWTTCEYLEHNLSWELNDQPFLLDESDADCDARVRSTFIDICKRFAAKPPFDCHRKIKIPVEEFDVRLYELNVYKAAGMSPMISLRERSAIDRLADVVED